MENETKPNPEDLIRAEYKKGIKHQDYQEDACGFNYWQGRIDTALAIAKRLGMKL